MTTEIQINDQTRSLVLTRKSSTKTYHRILSSALLILAFGFSSIANAVVVEIDWQTAGDNLITKDTISGLDWLDLTETNGMSRDYVLTQLGAGGIYEGWRYASSAEVVTLWLNFGLDLSNLDVNTQLNSSGASGLDPSLITATNYLGNTWCEYECSVYPYGVEGYTSDEYIETDPDLIPYAEPDWYFYLGASYTNEYGYVYKDHTSYWLSGASITPTYGSSLTLGSYLVQPSAVPVPGAVWLFGSGLIGLIGIAKRKKQ